MEQTSRGTQPSSKDKGKGKAPLQDETSNDSDDSDELEGDEDEDEEPEEDDVEEATESSNNGHLIALDHCRPIYDSDKPLPVYAFQIAYAKVQPYSLRIYDDGRVACSCDEKDCRHREWLLRQLSMIPSGQGPGAGTPPATIDYYNRIRRTGSHGLEDVCRALDWEFREGDIDTGTEWELQKQPPPSRPGEDRQTRRTIAQRVSTIRDIMDTFSATVRPADYRQDIFKDPTNIDVNNFYVEHDLEATFSRLLMFDNRMFHFFELLVSNDARAANFFLNMQLQAVDKLRLLDNYVDNGPGDDGRHYDIIWCAQELVNIVAAIDTNVSERGGGRLSPSSRTAAAGTLVSILEMVVSRDRDVYARIGWHRQKRHGEGRIHRNLYARLIGVVSSENPSGGVFVLKALQPLGPAATVYIERLETILHNVGPRGSQAPKAYQDKLREYIKELKDMPRPDRPGPSSSSGKRSGGSTSTDRNIKRMK
jgi:hypothetical protein